MYVYIYIYVCVCVYVWMELVVSSRSFTSLMCLHANPRGSNFCLAVICSPNEAPNLIGEAAKEHQRAEPDTLQPDATLSPKTT